MPNAPVKVAVSGAAGQIAYALLFRLAQGDVFGPDTPIDLRLLDLPQAQAALQGVVMELDDCAFPLLTSIQTTDDPIIALDDIDAAFLVGSRPRAKGMERRDLLAANAAIFKTQGAALNAVAKRSVKVLVVGNPANTNAWVAIQSAPDLPPGAITSMIRLDHNRAAAQFARRAGVPVDAVEKLAVWGNHSPTMFADWSHATVEGQSLAGLINDETWYRDTLIPEVARRGTAVLEARGASSAASAANAAINHMRDWVQGSNGRWVSMGVASIGQYDIPEGLVCGVPTTCRDGVYAPVTGLELDAFTRAGLAASVQELIEERDAALAVLADA